MENETRLREQWRRAANDLGLEILEDQQLRLPSGKTLRAIVLPSRLGAKNGIVIAIDYRPLNGLSDELAEAGYGFSALGAAGPEPDSSWSVVSVRGEVFARTPSPDSHCATAPVARFHLHSTTGSSPTDFRAHNTG